MEYLKPVFQTLRTKLELFTGNQNIPNIWIESEAVSIYVRQGVGLLFDDQHRTCLNIGGIRIHKKDLKDILIEGAIKAAHDANPFEVTCLDLDGRDELASWCESHGWIPKDEGEGRKVERWFLYKEKPKVTYAQYSAYEKTNTYIATPDSPYYQMLLS